MGMNQDLHNLLKQRNLVSKWYEKQGEYARSKVDFNEICDSLYKFGDDMQNKNIHKGDEFTAVYIGADSDKVYALEKNYIFDTVSYIPSLSNGGKHNSIIDAELKKIGIEVDKNLVIYKNDADKYSKIQDTQGNSNTGRS